MSLLLVQRAKCGRVEESPTDNKALLWLRKILPLTRFGIWRRMSSFRGRQNAVAKNIKLKYKNDNVYIDTDVYQ